MRYLMLFGLVSLLGWLTHIFVCFHTGAWGFLIAGAIAAPIGVLHGWYLWVTGFGTLISNLIGWII